MKLAVFRLARRFAFVQRKIAQARDDTLKSVYADMAKSVQGHKFAKALPEKGMSKVSAHRIEQHSLNALPSGRTARKTAHVPKLREDQLHIGQSLGLRLQSGEGRHHRNLQHRTSTR